MQVDGSIYPFEDVSRCSMNDVSSVARLTGERDQGIGLFDYSELLYTLLAEGLYHPFLVCFKYHMSVPQRLIDVRCRMETHH